MENFTDKYFKTLSLPINGSDSNVAHKDALNRAYSLRNIEIELYWKRAGYFWGYQIAIFAALGFVLKDFSENKSNMICLMISGLGVLTALANVLSARGSKFWQGNWEKHIDLLEDKFEGKLCKMVWFEDGLLSFSVTKINIKLNNIFLIFWIVLFLYLNEKFSDFWISKKINLEIYDYRQILYFFPLVIIFILGLYLFKSKSNITGIIPKLDESDKENMRGASDAGSLHANFFMLRYPANRKEL